MPHAAHPPSAIGRRMLLLSAAAAGLAGCQTTADRPGMPRDTATHPDRPLTLVYVRSSACPFCRDWELFAEPDWLRSPERARVSYRVLDFPHFSDITADSGWPPDLRWIRDELRLTRGTPRYILVRDRAVLLSQLGSNNWLREVMPGIRRALT